MIVSRSRGIAALSARGRVGSSRRRCSKILPGWLASNGRAGVEGAHRLAASALPVGVGQVRHVAEALADVFLERLAEDELHRDESAPVEDAGLVDDDDVRVAEARRERRLLLEALDRALAARAR